jgi:Flp pilus assembly protein TadG
MEPVSTFHDTQSQDTERGQSLLEFALGLVILLVLLAGVVDLGRAFFTYMSLRDAAQEGAAYASFCPLDSDGGRNLIVERVRSSSDFPLDLSAPEVQVNCTYLATGVACDTNGATVTPGTMVHVEVVYPDFHISMPFIGGFLGSQEFTLQAEANATILRDSTCP